MATVGKRTLAAALAVVAVACTETEAQDSTRVQSRVREQLGNVPAVVDTGLAAQLSATFRAASARALPGVVHIRVESQPRLAQGRERSLPPGLPPGLFPGVPGQSGPRVGTGSGFVFDQRGYILTNNHVIEDANEVMVRMVDGREYDAKVVGRDPNTDVAVIKIEPRGEIPVVQLGNSERVQVGDWVIALGNPLGLDFTVTAGIVSAKQRSIGILLEQQGNQALEAFIQTDAAINPGNSGGPLVDLLGRVVAINTAIESPTGTFAGAGFAIPINLARRVADDLMKYGVVHRPRLGVGVRPVSAADAEVYRLPSVEGAHIISVSANGPAARAGLRPGDVVVSINGRPVKTSTELTTMLAERRPGETVTLGYFRGGQRQETRATLEEFEVERAAATPQPSRPAAEQLLGFAVEPLTPTVANRLGLRRTTGVYVSDIPRLSAAGAAGVREGQVIVAINGQNVQTRADVDRIASRLKPGDVVQLRMIDPDDSIGETVVNYRTRG